MTSEFIRKLQFTNFTEEVTGHGTRVYRLLSDELKIEVAVTSNEETDCSIYYDKQNKLIALMKVNSYEDVISFMDFVKSLRAKK